MAFVNHVWFDWKANNHFLYQIQCLYYIIATELLANVEYTNIVLRLLQSAVSQNKNG